MQEVINVRSSKTIRFFCFLFFVWFALSIWGCVTTAKNINVAEELKQAEKDSSIVFGQIEWLEKGEKQEIGKGFLIRSVEPHLMKMEDKTRIIGEISEG